MIKHLKELAAQVDALPTDMSASFRITGDGIGIWVGRWVGHLLNGQRLYAQRTVPWSALQIAAVQSADGCIRPSTRPTR